MTFKIENLKDFEAVQAGDTVIIQVPHRWDGYMAGNRRLIGTQITINKDEPLYTYTAPQRAWIKTILKDGTELSAREVNAIHNQYYDDDEEKMVYPSLKEEFAHRERLLELSEGEKVYLEEEAILTPVQYTIVGELKDTGNPFVETAVSYGKGRFSTSDNSFFKLNVSGVIGDTLKKFAAEAELPFVNGTHSGYKYAKIKDQYVIGSGSKWEKQSENSFKYFPSLQDAQKYEDGIRKELHDYLAAKFNMTVIGKFVAAEIFADLQAILNKVEGLAVMQKAQDNKQYTKNAINVLMKKIGRSEMKRIKIIRTEDEYECDTCGWDWQESYQVEYEGKLYGNEAHATCFGAENTSMADALLLFIQAQGFEVEHEDVVYET